MRKSFELYLNIKFKKLFKLPFKYWKSFHLGIIDKDGYLLKELDELSTKEKMTHNVFTELARKIKRLILTYIPSGKGLLKYKIYDEWNKSGSNLNKVIEKCNINFKTNMTMLENRSDKIKEIFLECLNEN